jgi:hypothetical protein
VGVTLQVGVGLQVVNVGTMTSVPVKGKAETLIAKAARRSAVKATMLIVECRLSG